MPTINWEQGNNQVRAEIQLVLPGGKDVAVMHLHSAAGSIDQGTQFIVGLKSAKLMLTVPQPSFAVAAPVAFVAVLAGHSSTTLVGMASTGGVMSRTVMVWTQLEALPQVSA